ncbi:SDR family oxidoreductase [Devosia ginsengisoli]|uniref:SDR family oxidoreductase n=1 Tax=Devosia ginsengisoli TaxID=400770 RepID=UPI0026E99A76|nr:SDR family oxidoreductase [Devosia ginsengisoli]MCR6670229.1 SDR family oxidoreductase [Devosia ginsengisoli]
MDGSAANRINPPQQQDHQPGRETEMHPKPDYMPKFPGNGRLAGKVAIITGGDSGIGRACAVLFAREGAEVALVYLEESEDASITAGAVRAEGKQALLLRGDVGDKAFCDAVVDKVIEEFGKLDVLVNNAAEQHPQDEITDISAEQLQQTFETNLFGYFYLTQAAMPHLGKGAAIVNTTSVTAYRGSPTLLDYSATKGAIVSFTRALAGNLVDKGIRVNAVAPGPIWTPLIPATFDAEKVAEFGSDQPMKRPGQPNEVATCHLFLACDESSYLSGQVLHPNGGEITGG